MSSVQARHKRLLIGTILVLLLLVIFWFALKNTRANTEPIEVVQRFYSHWILAEDPIGDELHLRSTYVTDGFGRQTSRAAEKGVDTVLCGTPTQTFSLGTSRTVNDDSMATVEVHTDTTTVHVVLIRDDAGWWRIDEIDCEEKTELDLEKALEDARTLYGDKLLNG